MLGLFCSKHNLNKNLKLYLLDVIALMLENLSSNLGFYFFIKKEILVPRHRNVQDDSQTQISLYSTFRTANILDILSQKNHT